jgi:glycosyltransferase involved in cell wall biosynthesis
MNILMFGWEFPPNISGGLGTACYGIVKGLSACGDVNVTFVVPKAFGNEQSENARINIISANEVSTPDEISTEFKEISSEIESKAFTFIEVPSKLKPYLDPENFDEKYFSELKTLKKSKIRNKEVRFEFSGKYGPNLFDEINNYAIVAKTIAQQNQFEIIHAHDWLTFPAGIAAKSVTGKPLVLHVHSTDFDRSGGSVNPAIYEIEKHGFEEADSIITVSDRIKYRLTEQYNVPSRKITTIYNAIDSKSECELDFNSRDHKEKTVTFLGRITIQKGPEYFVNVARMVINKMKNVHFVMAGNGELRNQMLDLCARYGITDRFHFAGFLNGNEVSRLLHRSDLFIMPSVSEPFGIVPLEAMQANVPVIISRQSGVAELIRKVIKTDFWDVHAMADAVHGILRYKKLSKTMIAEGKQEVNKLNWENSALNIRQVYLNILSKLAY